MSNAADNDGDTMYRRNPLRGAERGVAIFMFFFVLNDGGEAKISYHSNSVPPSGCDGLVLRLLILNCSPSLLQCFGTTLRERFR